MTKHELIEQVARETDFYKADVREMVDACLNVVHYTLAKGEKICISDFMTIIPVEVPARMNRNPKTGGQKFVDDHVRIKTVISRTMIEGLNNGRYKEV